MGVAEGEGDECGGLEGGWMDGWMVLLVGWVGWFGGWDGWSFCLGWGGRFGDGGVVVVEV